MPKRQRVQESKQAHALPEDEKAARETFVKAIHEFVPFITEQEHHTKASENWTWFVETYLLPMLRHPAFQKPGGAQRILSAFRVIEEDAELYPFIRLYAKESPFTTAWLHGIEFGGKHWMEWKECGLLVTHEDSRIDLLYRDIGEINTSGILLGLSTCCSVANATTMCLPSMPGMVSNKVALTTTEPSIITPRPLPLLFALVNALFKAKFDVDFKLENAPHSFEDMLQFQFKPETLYHACICAPKFPFQFPHWNILALMEPSFWKGLWETWKRGVCCKTYMSERDDPNVVTPPNLTIIAIMDMEHMFYTFYTLLRTSLPAVFPDRNARIFLKTIKPLIRNNDSLIGSLRLYLKGRYDWKYTDMEQEGVQCFQDDATYARKDEVSNLIEKLEFWEERAKEQKANMKELKSG